MPIAAELEIREIQYNSTDYQAELILRDKILRQPLGMSLFDEDLSQDKIDHHFAAFYKNEMIACTLLSPKTDIEIKMRQVAIYSDFQSMKVGSKMMEYCEHYCREKGYKRIILNARKTALEFYKKNNYSIDGNEFLEVGIPHFRMHKVL